MNGQTQKELQVSYDLESEIRQKQDEFLDAFSDYLRAPDALHRKVIARKALDLRLLDPNFNFSLE